MKENDLFFDTSSKTDRDAGEKVIFIGQVTMLSQRLILHVESCHT